MTESETAEVVLQLMVRESTELTATLFVLTCYVWVVAIWGAFVLDY